MLGDLTVLDFSQLLPGNYATMWLADLGAQVIKIEPPEGEAQRRIGPLHGGESIIFAELNRNKKSIFVNLKNESERAEVLALAASADVIVESFRPGVADRLGVGYRELSAQRPSLVYASLTGYGQTGPWRDFPGHDLNYLALTGALLAKTGSPRPLSIQVADLAGAMASVIGILAALRQRDRTGKGSYLDISLAEAAASWSSLLAVTALAGEEEAIPNLLGGGVICYNVYAARDGYVTLGALEEKFWRTFCIAVGHPEWQDQGMTVAEEGQPVYHALKGLFLERTSHEWEQFGVANGLPLVKVRTALEGLASGSFKARTMIFESNAGSYIRLPLSIIPPGESWQPGIVPGGTWEQAINPKPAARFINDSLGQPLKEVNQVGKSRN